eukprot:4870602-Alexandrium_andersonii.AAC.1
MLGSWSSESSLFGVNAGRYAKLIRRITLRVPGPSGQTAPSFAQIPTLPKKGAGERAGGASRAGGG